MPKIFKPRRGKKATMYGSKSTTVLSQGELFIEVPDSGVGTGKSKMKLGDGVTPYKDLPYAMGDTENDKIVFDSNTSTDITAALNDVSSGSSLGELIGALKQAIKLNQDNVTQLNEDLRKDFQDGCKKIADALTAAGVPTTGTDFSTLTQNIETLKNQSYSNGYTDGNNAGIKATKVGTATSSQVLTGYSFTNSSSVGINGSMPNRGNLNWNSSNTTYNIQPGYYSGGTLDSRTSYTNGYNSGYNKGKEEGGEEINIDGGKYSGNIIDLSAIIPTELGRLRLELNDDSALETGVVQIPLPKSNPSTIIINTFRKGTINGVTEKTVNETWSSTTTYQFQRDAFYTKFSLSNGTNYYPTGVTTYLHGLYLSSMSTSWQIKYSCYANYNDTCKIHLEARTNGKILELRLRRTSGIRSAYQPYIQLCFGTYKESGPYGSVSIKGTDNLLACIQCN